jgi:ribonuclease J
MLNKLFGLGANVIYGKLATVHVSGHGSRGEMEAMLKATKPKFLIPVHGEVRHLHLHARLAQEGGLPAERIFVLENGAAWATDGKKAWLDPAVAASAILVDGRLVGEVEAIVVRDRQRLSQDGFIVALIPVNSKNKLAGEPQLISRGFVPEGGSDALLSAAVREIKAQYQRGQIVAHDNLRDTLQNFLYRETRSRPVVLPSFIRV